MTDSAQGDAAAVLARTKRIEIQHFADGGSVRRTTVKNFAKPTGAAAMLAQMPVSHAGAKPMEHGGAVHGPGGPTADKVPIWASAGEFMLPADTAAKVGKDKLDALVDATHTPTRSPAEKMGRLARADGGLIDPGSVTRVGNSYSGGSVTGGIAVNGQAPGGTVSTVDSFRAPPPPAAPPVLGAPAAVTPVALKPVASPMATLPTPATAAPPPAPLDYANRNAAFNAGAQARTSALSTPGVRSSNVAAPPAAGTAAAALAARPVQSIAGYADGGEIDDPRKPLPTFASPDAAAQALAGMASDARSNMAASVQMASLSPALAAASAGPQPYVAEIPRGRYESAAPEPDPVSTAAPAPVAAPVAAPPAQAPTAAPAPVPGPAAATVAPIPDTTAAVAPATAQAQLAALPGARTNPLGGLADTNAQLASLQASNASLPQGGATVIDNAASEADRRAQFNEQANLGNALARTSWSPRRGTQVNDAAVAAALTPIDARARMAQVTAKEAGDTQRATIQERGADARSRQAAGVEQQRLAIEGKKVTLDANRDDRAAAAAEPALALAQRKSSLQTVVADPKSTPAQRQAAAQQLAGMEGKELVGHAPPAGYERTPDGNLKFIKGGPADPDTPKGKNNLTDTQAKALQFGSRMQEANEIFDKLEKDGKLFSTPGANNPITGGIVNQFNTAAGQQLDQAKRNFVNAVLRRESGAAIAPSEFDSADKQYFPQPGDDQKVIDQKRSNRELSMRGILAEVPDADTRISKIRNPQGQTPAAPGGVPAAQTPGTSVPAGMNRQVGTSGGKPVFEDANGRRFVAG